MLPIISGIILGRPKKAGVFTLKRIRVKNGSFDYST